MTGDSAVSVPGKTILLGEHAAVYGYPALVAALDLRMTVTVKSAPGDGTIRLAMPGFGVNAAYGAAETAAALAEAKAVWSRAFEGDGGGRFRPVGDPAALALAAVAETADARWRTGRNLTVRIDSAIPAGAGFGSSAALAVGIAAACRRASGAGASPDEVAEAALRIERYQHGRPSGVDVHAVLRGGVVWCRRREGGIDIEDIRGAETALGAWRLFDSGAPAESTGEMVAGVRRALEADRTRVEDAFASVEAGTREGRAALGRGDVAALVAVVRRVEAALESIDVVHPRVREVIRAIEASGGAAKISGAGGRTGAGAGLVLVVHPDPGWHARFAVPSGWTPHRVALGAAGLREEVAA